MMHTFIETLKGWCLTMAYIYAVAFACLSLVVPILPVVLRTIDSRKHHCTDPANPAKFRCNVWHWSGLCAGEWQSTWSALEIKRRKLIVFWGILDDVFPIVLWSFLTAFCHADTQTHTHPHIYLPMQARLIWENLAKWHSFRIFKWKLNWNRTDYSKSHVEFGIIYHVLSWMMVWFTSFIFHILRLSASNRTYQKANISVLTSEWKTFDLRFEGLISIIILLVKLALYLSSYRSHLWSSSML